MSNRDWLPSLRIGPNRFLQYGQPIHSPPFLVAAKASKFERIKIYYLFILGKKNCTERIHCIYYTSSEEVQLTSFFELSGTGRMQQQDGNRIHHHTWTKKLFSIKKIGVLYPTRQQFLLAT